MIHEVELLGIDETGWHGVYAHEREDGQIFVADVWFRVEINEQSEVSDSLSATADYSRIIDSVRTRIAGEPVNLIETLARELLQIVLAAHPAIVWARVKLHKPQAPVSRAVSDISVSVTSER